MKSSSYLRAQNFAAPSINHDNERNEISTTKHKKSSLSSSINNNDIMIRTNNIMFDSRVCRGNTYATPVLTEDQRRNKSVYERMQRVRRSSIEKRNLEVSERVIFVSKLCIFGRLIVVYGLFTREKIQKIRVLYELTFYTTIQLALYYYF
jgi:hypothetical protein